MENFSMTFAKNRTYGVPEFAGTEVNRHSGKLKGLSGYLQNHHDTKGLSRASSSSGPSRANSMSVNQQSVGHHRFCSQKPSGQSENSYNMLASNFSVTKAQYACK